MRINKARYKNIIKLTHNPHKTALPHKKPIYSVKCVGHKCTHEYYFSRQYGGWHHIYNLLLIKY